ncbi:Adaptive-response sensory-kinase SasA [Ralstonia condita]|uniref:histidine kinase n=1 Tax=Ralstonia condita TaxID=3058600 RepID=A0ABM9IWJ3_9RALS|nr:two-component system hybrid sensor histidine kinase/response regulator PhcR [Ralstonia sp. LMG 7141]CAJ0774332.1 Adaptive-response sensory-kinase SasA [Ralstonia sp. LMG 7141]
MDTKPDTVTILYVDDEAQACKWFARTFGAGYEVLTANSVAQAQAVLRDAHERISVVLTDFRMPGGNGTELLRFIDAQYGDIATILVTAYADKDLLIQAVNTGRVFKILEKPYQPDDVRRSLQEALALRQDRLLRTQRLMAIDETLAFLAHELNTPLAAISNFARGIRMRVDQAEPTPEALPEIGRAADRVQDNARYCLSVIATFLNSVRNTYGKPGTAATPNSAGGLIRSLLDTYPFTNAQREWVSYRVEHDFPIQTLPNCVMLVLSSLTSNALRALRDTSAPRLEIIAAHTTEAAGGGRHMICIQDNGPGIAPDVLARLTIDPVTTRAEEGGNGMGMIFCTRIMQSFGGAIAIDSAPSAGTRVTLTFP